MQSPILQPTSPPSGASTAPRPFRKRLVRAGLSVLAGIGLTASAVSPIGLTQPSPTFAQSAYTPVDGVQMISQRLTLPRGALFLGGNLGSATTTHWWVTDQVLGICRVDGASAPYQLT